ncbi:hypothetical protein D3C78_1494980 [compost metagenome]
MGRADQFLWVGALAAFEARLEAVGRFAQHTGFRGDGADTGFQVTFPMSRCFLDDSHVCLLKIRRERRAWVFF